MRLDTTNLKLFSDLGDVRIICLVRNQCDYLQSVYNQQVKMFATRFTGSIYVYFMYHDVSTHMTYHQLLAGWEKQFGAGSVRAFNFDMFVEKNDICNLFFNELGLPTVTADQNMQFVNESISAEATVYMARLNSRKNIIQEQHQTALKL